MEERDDLLSIESIKCEELLSIELIGYQQDKFLEYLEITSNNIKNIKNFLIYPRNDSSSSTYENSTVAPSFGEFEWIDEKKNVFTIIIKQIGEKPVVTPNGVHFFKRIFIKHKDLNILKYFTTKALTEIKPIENGKIRIYNSTSKGYWELNTTSYCQSLEQIYIPEENKDLIISSIEKFILSKEKYIKFGINYKLAFLLNGIMGAGKSSLVKAIAKKYNKNIYLLNFTKGMTDETLFELMSCLREDSILLIEDIDAFFIDRDPKNINISFSGFLNILDGVLSRGVGTLIFITANHANQLDPALIRPGRIDTIINFDYPKRREIEKLFMQMINNVTNEDFEIFFKKLNSKKITMAAIVNYLFKYTENYKDHLDELITQTFLFNQIVNDNTDKLYS